MSFKSRYILSVLVNSLAIIGFLVLGAALDWNLAQRRLTDLNVSQTQDLQIIGAFVGAMILALLANVILLFARQRDVTMDELQRLVLKLQ